MKWTQKTPKLEYRKHDDIATKLCRINGIENVNKFLTPTEDALHSPYELTNIEQAAAEILSAAIKNLRICVSYDPDSDGLTSNSMMYRYLKNFTNNIYYSFGERLSGHGLETQLDNITDDTDLLVICDHSTNSIDACKQIAEKGIRIIIIDHHISEEANSHALIVNPQLDNSKNKDLSGAGVVYKVLQVMDDISNNEYASEFLDLASVGMVSDVMSMLEPENRYLIAQGLRNMKNPGLRAIIKVAGLNEYKLKSQDIGYTFGPMLNGAARMGQLELAIKLLLEDDEKTCQKLAKEMQKLNETRKQLEAKYFEQIKPQIDETNKVIIVIDNTIDKSFNGLIATKIANTYQRPAIVFNEDDNRYVGSYRTYGDFDMKFFLEQLELSDFVRGHTGAGGYSVNKKLLEKLQRQCNIQLRNEKFEQQIEYDLELTKDEITTDLIKQIERFNWITGKDIPAAKFLVKNLFVSDNKIMGKNVDTVKIFTDSLALMKFRLANAEEFSQQFSSFDSVNAVGMLYVNEFYNFGKKQLEITNTMILDDIELVN